MNSAQRLLRVAAVVLMVLMVLYPPFLVRDELQNTRWLAYGALWAPPFPLKEEALPRQPFCEGFSTNGLILLVQLVVLWMGSSGLYTLFGRINWDEDKYPEYYRP